MAAPFMIFGLLFTELSPGWAAGSVIRTIAAGTVGHLVLGLVLWIARHTLFHPKRRNQVGWREVVGTLVAGGLSRAGVLNALLDGPGIADVEFGVRAGNSVGLVVFSFSVASYSAQLWRDYRDRRYELLYSIAVGGQVSQQQEIAHSEFRSLASEGLGGDMERARDRTMQALGSIRTAIQSGSAATPGLVDLLQETDRDWRALSHKTWLKGQPAVPRLGAGEVLRTLAESRPLSLLVMSGGPAFMFSRAIDDLGLYSTFLFTGLWWLGLAALAIATNLVAESARRAGGAILVIGFVLLQLWSVAVGAVFLDSVFLQIQTSFVGMVSSAAAVALGLPVALERSGKAVLEQLEQRLSATTLESLRSQSEMFVLAQRVGTYLHSEVRADFLRLSLRLREALERGDRETALATIGELEKRVAEIDLTAPQYSEIDNLLQFLNNWAGVIRLSHNVDSATVPDGLDGIVSAVIMEAVSNAVRHTDATEVNVRAAQGPTDFTIEVSNDGNATDGEAIAGLGSEALDLVAPQSWSRQTGADGIHRLKVSLPLP